LILTEASRKGKMEFTVGDAENLEHFTFVRTWSMEHQSWDMALGEKAYYIIREEPIPFWMLLS
jgi:hypothetical protein